MLVTVDQVVAALGLPWGLSSEMEPAVTRAITRAQTEVEQTLGHRLDRRVSTDVFLLDPDLFCGVVPGGRFTCRLRSQFLYGEPGLFYGDTWRAQEEPVDPEVALVDPYKGLVFVDEQFSGKFIRVTYTSGFADHQDVDPVITEAMITLMPAMLQPVQQDQDKPNTSNLRDLRRAALAVLSVFDRTTKGFHYQPISHVDQPVAE